jgi:hypothetical protein
MCRSTQVHARGQEKFKDHRVSFSAAKNVCCCWIILGLAQMCEGETFDWLSIDLERSTAILELDFHGPSGSRFPFAFSPAFSCSKNRKAELRFDGNGAARQGSCR